MLLKVLTAIFCIALLYQLFALTHDKPSTFQPLWDSWRFPLIYGGALRDAPCSARSTAISNPQSPNTRSPCCKWSRNPLLDVVRYTTAPGLWWKYNSPRGTDGARNVSVVFLVGWNVCVLASNERIVAFYKYFRAVYNIQGVGMSIISIESVRQYRAYSFFDRPIDHMLEFSWCNIKPTVKDSANQHNKTSSYT